MQPGDPPPPSPGPVPLVDPTLQPDPPNVVPVGPPISEFPQMADVKAGDTRLPLGVATNNVLDHVTLMDTVILKFTPFGQTATKYVVTHQLMGEPAEPKNYICLVSPPLAYDSPAGTKWLRTDPDGPPAP